MIRMQRREKPKISRNYTRTGLMRITMESSGHKNIGFYVSITLTTVLLNKLKY